MCIPGSILEYLVYSLIAAKGGLVAIEAADTAVFSDGNGVTPAAIVNVGYASASHAGTSRLSIQDRHSASLVNPEAKSIGTVPKLQSSNLFGFTICQITPDAEYVLCKKFP